MKSTQTKFYIGLDVHESMTAYAVRRYTGQVVLSGECATRYEDLHKILEPYLFKKIHNLIFHIYSFSI